MKIKNELVKIKIGDKKYDFHNLILDEYLKRFIIAQIDKEKAVSRHVSHLKDLSYIALKFDTPLENFNENSEIGYYDFDICIVNKAKYSQTVNEKQITIQYDYENKQDEFVVDIKIASQGGDCSTGAIKYLRDFFGKKITAIGFTTHWWYNQSLPVCAVLDTSNYNIYLEKNQDFAVTRKDIITTDAEFWTNDKSKIPGPAHLAPFGFPQIIYQRDIIDSEGGINSFYNNTYGILHSVGKGYTSDVMKEEKIIGKDAIVVNNGTSLTISSIQNEDIGTETLYPSEDLYPSNDLYPMKDNYKYIILKYKIYQLVVTGEYTEEDGYLQEIKDTGRYYYQSVPLEKYGKLETTIKYERG